MTKIKCYNCGEEVEEIFISKIKVTIESGMDKYIKFKDEKTPTTYENDKICSTCALIICGVLNKNVMHPDLREKGVPQLEQPRTPIN